MRTLRSIVLIFAAATLAVDPTPALAQAVTETKPAPATPYDGALKTMSGKVGSLRGLAATLRTASEQPNPPGLTAAQVAEAKKYDAWLVGASGRVTKLAAAWEQKINALRIACEKDPLCKKDAAAKDMNELNMSFSMEYLALKTAMENENLSYTAVSSIMKTKHDTVKNSISNVR